MDAANHHEVRLVQLCFDFYMIEAKPETSLAIDRAHDSDPLNDGLTQRRYRNGRTAPIQSSQVRHAKWTPTPAICEALVGRTVLRLNPMATPYSYPLGVLSEELPWLRATRLLVVLFKRLWNRFEYLFNILPYLTSMSVEILR